MSGKVPRNEIYLRFVYFLSALNMVKLEINDTVSQFSCCSAVSSGKFLHNSMKIPCRNMNKSVRMTNNPR